MAEEVRSLVPDRRHFVATAETWPSLQHELKPYRIGLAPVMLTRESNALRRAAYRLAPHKILAYNSQLDRHHLRFDLPSLLFWRGVPLDRIYLRPRSWPGPEPERSAVLQGAAGAPRARARRCRRRCANAPSPRCTGPSPRNAASSASSNCKWSTHNWPNTPATCWWSTTSLSTSSQIGRASC